MYKTELFERLEAKTPEQRFVQMLEQEFRLAPRVAQVILEEAQASLIEPVTTSPAGQIRVVVAKQEAGHGRALSQTDLVEVSWTVDAGLEDWQIGQQHGAAALRQVRIQRLLGEALEQGGVASQEDLARALEVSVRTIKRDFKELEAQGLYLPTRGNLHGIGRGQTHKAQIIRRWLQGQTYDQIVLATHHSLTSIKRYIQTFVRVIELHQQQFSQSQISLLLQSGPALIREYLAVYEQNDSPECRQRLGEQLARLSGAAAVKRGGQ
jgi:biotin operon repressor